MSTRSLRSDVRNPVLALPGVVELQNFPPEIRAALATVIGAIGADARIRAQESWRKNKGPMAAYWKAVGAYSTHLKRAIRP
jgi:hypothetical protein